MMLVPENLESSHAGVDPGSVAGKNQSKVSSHSAGRGYFPKSGGFSSRIDHGATIA
jgi:hypothetical protein